MRTYEVISGDGHIEGPIDFTPYLPDKYADVAPTLAERDDGAWVWQADVRGHALSSLVGSNVYSGLRYDQFTAANACTYWNPDGSLRPGTSPDPAVRLREQDQDGIDAEVLYFPMAAGLMVGAASLLDADGHRAGVRAYTEFLADYCSVAPDRLIGTMLLPSTGIDDVLAELQYARGRGLRAVCLQNWPRGNEPTPEDDRFWEAVLDLGMTVSPHISFGNGQVPEHEIHVTPQRAMGGFNQYANPRTTMPIAQLIHAGVFDRFPALKVYFAESEVSWLAGWLEYIDEFYERWAAFHGLELSKMPSDYVRDHCRFCMISDRMAVPLRHYIGTEMFLWGSDFPHSVGTFPDSRYVLDEFFEGVPDDERRRVLVENPCDVFGLDPDHELTPTP